MDEGPATPGLSPSSTRAILGDLIIVVADAMVEINRTRAALGLLAGAVGDLLAERADASASRMEELRAELAEQESRQDQRWSEVMGVLQRFAGDADG